MVGRGGEGGDNRPENPIYFIGSTSFFSPNCDWSGLDMVISSRLFLASGEFYVLWEKKYAISLYRHDVCIYSGSREQIENVVRETSRSSASYFSP